MLNRRKIISRSSSVRINSSMTAVFLMPGHWKNKGNNKVNTEISRISKNLN
jgi:hypothetical protein